MRINLHLSPNTEPVPFDYQRSLVGAFHGWLGENDLHDDLSLYSLSSLQQLRRARYTTNREKTGLIFPYGAKMFISSPLLELHQAAVKGIFDRQYIRWGMRVQRVHMEVTPNFGERERFLAQSPILIKRGIPDTRQTRYYFPNDPEAGDLLTETLQRKLRRLHLSEDVRVDFDATYANPKIDMITYNGIKIKATKCPVIVQGHPQAVAAAWDVGVGNSTGIGFGALV